MIIYVKRDPEKLYDSLYNQLIKDLTDLSIKKKDFEIVFNNFFNYDKIINDWKKIFSNSSFIELKYSNNLLKEFDKIFEFGAKPVEQNEN